MAFRLTEPQAQLIGLVERQLAQKATPQVRFFWKKLRTAALPPMPARRPRQTPVEYALEQSRWQRVAALSVESHVAAAQLLRQEVELMREVNATSSQTGITPAEAANQLSEAIRAAPVAVQYRIFQEILGAHPNWSDDE